MTDTPPIDALLLHRFELHDEPEVLAAQVEASAELRATLETLDEAFAACPSPPPKGLYKDLKARLEAELAAEAEGPKLLVKLGCRTCKGALAAAEAVYCASCLAPYHGDCFADYGRCAIAGCGELRVVGAVPMPGPRPATVQRGWRTGWIGAGIILCAGSGAIAALIGESWRGAEPPTTQQAAPSQVEAIAVQRAREARERELLETRRKEEAIRLQRELEARLAETLAAQQGEPGLEIYQVVDILGEARGDRVEVIGLDEVFSNETRWLPPGLAQVRERLRVQKVTLNFADTPAADAIAFLRDITGLNLHAQELDPEASVSLRLRGVSLGQAITHIRDALGLAVSLMDGAIVFHEPGAPLATGVGLLEQVEARSGISEAQLRDLVRALIPRPDEEQVIVERGQLIVSAHPIEHAAIRELLKGLRSGEPHGKPPGDPLASPIRPLLGWRGGPSDESSVRLRLLLGERLLTLNFQETGFAEAFAVLQQIIPGHYGLSLRAEGFDLASQSPLTLRVREVSLDTVARLLTAGRDLTLEVDRGGLVLRPQRKGPEAYKLEQRARDAIAEARGADPAVFELLNSPRPALKGRFKARELMLFIQDVSSLNLTLEPSAEDALEAEVAVPALPDDATLCELMDAILAPLELGLSVRSGVVRVLPRSEATYTEEARTRLREIEQREVSAQWGVAPGAALAAIAAEAELELVWLTADLRRGRIFLPSGLDLRAALVNLRRQSGLSCELAVSSGDSKPILAVFDAGLSSESAALWRLSVATPPAILPETAVAAWMAARADLEAGLARLSEPLAADAFAALWSSLRPPAQALRELEAFAKAAWEAETVAPEDKQGLARELTELEAACRAEQARMQVEVEAHELVARQAQVEISTLQSARGANDEPSEEERALIEQRKEAREASARSSKLARLALARSQSEIADRRVEYERFLIARALRAATRELSAQLKGGASWEEALPEGYLNWRDALRNKEVAAARALREAGAKASGD